MLDTGHGSYYDGNSQGGIIGGALDGRGARLRPRRPRRARHELLDPAARAPSTSTTYAPIALPGLPGRARAPAAARLLQVLWDRGEADGYAQHMTTDPLPDTPPHHVLIQVAFGDHQVANVTAEVEARTIGAATPNPPVAAGRFPDRTPLYGIPRITSFPFDGSAIVYFDSGTPTPPTSNVPNDAGRDPHETPRNDPAAREQKSAFLQVGGKVIDVCGAKPCTAVDPPG